MDVLRKCFIHVICYPSGIFIECKASVSSPCLASISKRSMRLKRLDTVWLWFTILVDQVLASCITTLVSNPNSQVILKYSQVYLTQPSTIHSDHESWRIQTTRIREHGCYNSSNISIEIVHLYPLSRDSQCQGSWDPQHLFPWSVAEFHYEALS